MKGFYKYPIPRPDGYEILIEGPNVKTSRYAQKSIPDQDERIPGSSPSSHPTPAPSLTRPHPAPLDKKNLG